MQITYLLNEKDVLEAQKTHSGVWVKAVSILGFLLLAMSFVYLLVSPRQLLSFAGTIAVGLFLACFLRLQVWFVFRQDKRFLEPFEAIISDSGINASNSKASSKYDWKAFVRYTESKNLFLVYQSTRVFNIFPKRAFAQGEVDEFRSLLDNKLGAASAVQRRRIGPRTWAFLIVVTVSAILLVMAIRNTAR